MKKILVPTDFSKQAEKALKVAAQLAKKHNGEIYLLHLLEIPLQNTFNASTEPPEAMFFMTLVRNHFKKIIAKPYLKGITVHETVKFDKTFNDIVDITRECNADLIIMGSHGASGLHEMFVGSNAEKVVRIANVPVLVIKNEHPNFKVDNFVFASDFKNDNKQTYYQATKIAEMLNAKIHLLLVNTANRFSSTINATKRIEKFISDYDFNNYSINIYNDDSVENGILNFSKTINADLIGVSTHGRQGIAHFFNGSITEDLVNHAKRPIITFKI